MKIKKYAINKFLFLIVLVITFTNAKGQDTLPKPKSEFWKKVSFIPSIGLGFGSGYSNVSVAPAAVYKINKYISTGLGLQYSYLKQNNLFSSTTYGGSLITLVNPLKELQLSVELEQLKASVKNEVIAVKSDFWNTAFFVGAGYRFGNSVIGARYNLLFNEDKGVYGDALLPFVRIAF